MELRFSASICRFSRTSRSWNLDSCGLGKSFNLWIMEWSLSRPWSHGQFKPIFSYPKIHFEVKTSCSKSVDLTLSTKHFVLKKILQWKAGRALILDSSNVNFNLSHVRSRLTFDWMVRCQEPNVWSRVSLTRFFGFLDCFSWEEKKRDGGCQV